MSEEAKVNGEEVLAEAEGFSEKEKAANRPGETETEKADSETEEAETGTEKPETGTEKRDWVGEAVQCFIKDAGDIDPTDPISAIAHYFAKNATPDLKARCEKEGKNATGCWRFIEAVARKALGNRPGHIDPSAIYAIAMHWFEDVPKDWDRKAERSSAIKSKPKKPTTRKERLEERVSHGSTKAKAELRELKKKERAKAKAAKKRKPKQQQGFFFEMLETPATAPEAAASGTKQESEVKG